MKLRVSAPNLTSPTYDTLREYANKRFIKIENLVKKPKKDSESQIRISVRKVGDFFKLTAELFQPYHVVIHSVDRDIRKVVDDAWNLLSRKMKNTKDKLIDSHRGAEDLAFGYPQLIM